MTKKGTKLPRDRQCSDCPTMITKSSKTGRCITCHNRHMAADPVIHARQAEASRRRYDDPAFAARMRQHCREVGAANRNDPVKRARLVELGKERIKLLHSPEVRLISHGAEARRKQSLKQTERHLGWCPPEWRAEYKRLTDSKRLPAADARRIVLDQARTERARLSPFERQDAALREQMRRQA